MLVYGTNASINKDDVGVRLENFFWRLWANTRLLKKMDGSGLARLFASIVTASSVSSVGAAILEWKKVSPIHCPFVNKPRANPT